MDDMRRTITALALLILSAGAHAASKEESCKAYQSAAESVMEMRQDHRGVHAIYDNIEDAGVELTGFMREMTVDAFDVRVRDTEAGKDEAIREYGEQWYSICRERWDG